jgi:Anti-sigma-K factor rskA, C-terminal
VNCDQFHAARAGREDSAEARAHRAECEECRSIDASLTAVAPRLADPAVWEEPARDLEARVMATIGEPDSAEPASRWMRWLVAAVVVAVLAGGVAFVRRSPGPDWEVSLAATGNAPGARATAVGWKEEAGTRIVLSVSGLSPAPDGYVYELWLSSPVARVSAGTFHSAGDVELWAAVSRRDYPRLWVTLQPAGVYDDYVTVLDTGQT